MSRMRCDLCGSEDNVWLSVNGQCCEACEETDLVKALKLAEETAQLLAQLVAKLERKDRP
jgi:hypothetical protein